MIRRRLKNWPQPPLQPLSSKMPAQPAPYQRVLVEGIPYWKDPQGSLYYYESATHPTPETRICLGTESTGLSADWQTLLQDKLTSYRAGLASRSRAVAAAPAPQ